MYTYCSGVILTEDWILTSARCVADFRIEDLEVAYGIRNPQRPESHNGIIIKIIHPDFNRNMFVNDIAMLLTKKKIEFVPNVIDWIRLPIEAPKDGEAVTVSSWVWRKVSPSRDLKIFPKKLIF